MCKVVFVQALEQRVLFAVAPDIYEQYLVCLVNRARQDPVAEATRFGIDLNEGVPADELITSTPKQPLAVSAILDQAAIDHTLWMLANNTFSHIGLNGSTPYDRDAAAGYIFQEPYSWGENLAYSGMQGSVPQIMPTLERMYQNLFVDAGIDGRGHRVTMFEDYFQQTGAGISDGVMTNSSGISNVWMLTQEFASAKGNAFLTGVIFADTLVKDGFYTPGEGFGGVVVEARNTATGNIYRTTSWDAGGYSLQLPAGSYSIRAYDGDMPEPVSRGMVTIGTSNVLLDMNMTNQPRGPKITPNGVLQIIGVPGNDTIRLFNIGDRIRIYWNQGTYEVTRNLVNLIEIHTGTGNDYIDIGGNLPTAGIYGDAGNDTIYGGTSVDYIYGNDGDDYLYGRLGSDCISGGNGNDTILGGGGNDNIGGGTGTDSINGEDGNDIINGGDSNDWLAGGNGTDTIDGETGNDTIYGGPDADVLNGNDGNDIIWGGAGNDTIDCGAGSNVAVGELGDDYIAGGDGNDTLSGGAGSDSLSGQAGNDFLIAADQYRDTVDGGDGMDTAIADLLDYKVNIEL